MLWLSVHLGQLAPTTLPQCRFVSNSRSAGLSLSLWPFASRASLSACLALFTLPRGFIFLLTLPRGFFSLLTLPTLSLCPSLPRVSASSYPPSACWLISSISPFAWRCAQQRVREPHSVPRYRVRLPEECFVKQPYEMSSARQPHVQAVSIPTHRGWHRSVALCRWTVEDCLPLERVPLASTLGPPLNLHVCQGPSLQGPVDLDPAIWCVGGGGHKATDTELTYAPVSQAYGHRHKLQFIVGPAALQHTSIEGRMLP